MLDNKTIAILVSSTLFHGGAANAAIQLPTLDDCADYRVHPDPRSKSAQADRKIWLLNRLLKIARDCRKQKKFEDSLRAYEAAYVLNPSFFRDQPERAYLYADMNRWTDAKREFDRAISHSIIASEQARLAAEYCLTHNQPSIAYGFKKALATAMEEPNTSLTLSKVLAAGGEPEAAKAAAKRAYYLCFAFGVDPEPARKQLESLTNQTAQEPTANRKNEPTFWTKVDSIVGLKKPPPPTTARNFIDESRILTGYHGKKDSGVQTDFASTSLDGTLRKVSLRPSNDYRLSEVWLFPNLLSCCLNEQDVRDHFKKLEPNVEFNNLTFTESDDIMQAAFEWGGIRCRFARIGFKPLRSMEFFWTVPGEQLPNAQLLLKPVKPDDRSWRDVLESAKVNLTKRRFKECQKQLVFSCNLWLDSSSGNKDLRRHEQYAAFKNAFIQLYDAWGKPEIADYFRAVALWQLRREIQRMECGDVDEFPTVQEFRHTMWDVRGGSSDQMYEIRVRMMELMIARPGSALYDRLSAVCGDTGFDSKKIFPLEPELLDDADEWFTD